MRRLRAVTLLRAAAGAAAVFLLAGAANGAAQTRSGGGLTVQLQQGWNNVPYYGPEAEPGVALASISGRYSAVWYWDAPRQRYLRHSTDSAATSDLFSMIAGRSYWIVATAAATLSLAAPAAGAVPALTKGWNNFVYTGPKLPVERALALLHGRYAGVYAWEVAGQRFRAYTAGGGPSGLRELEPYNCYWIAFT